MAPLSAVHERAAGRSFAGWFVCISLNGILLWCFGTSGGGVVYFSGSPRP